MEVIGLFIYSVVTFEPLHILGARYIGQRSPSGLFVAAQCSRRY